MWYFSTGNNVTELMTEFMAQVKYVAEVKATWGLGLESANI
jgi:hypothetical protein